MQSKQYFTKIKNYPHEKSTEPFFPVGVGTFPTELSGRGRFLFRIRKGVKKIVFHNFFMIIEYIYHLNLNNF